MIDPAAGHGPDDWRSYDAIADRYDRVWFGRFDPVARHIWALMPARAGETLLDIGTGTGIVPAALDGAGAAPRLVVGCDRSRRMLERARGRMPALAIVAADANALSFASEAFEVVSASFVLSHVPDYAAALTDAYRVLKPAGRIAVTNWAPSSDPYASLWTECLSDLISTEEVRRALSEVAPWESHLSQPGRLETALREAGFIVVAAATPEITFASTVEQFVRDRELSGGGRLGRALVGAPPWESFRQATCDRFHRRFGPSWSYVRSAIIVVGQKP